PSDPSSSVGLCLTSQGAFGRASSSLRYDQRWTFRIPYGAGSHLPKIPMRGACPPPDRLREASMARVSSVIWSSSVQRGRAATYQVACFQHLYLMQSYCFEPPLNGRPRLWMVALRRKPVKGVEQGPLQLLSRIQRELPGIVRD